MRSAEREVWFWLCRPSGVSLNLGIYGTLNALEGQYFLCCFTLVIQAVFCCLKINVANGHGSTFGLIP